VDANEAPSDSEVVRSPGNNVTSQTARAEVVDLLAAAVFRLVLEHRRAGDTAGGSEEIEHARYPRERDRS
jgi:hypothetical protein